MRRSLEERFEERIVPEPNSGCWLWIGACLPNGYGSIRVNMERPTQYAHRVSWEMHRGPIPDGMWVLHKCDTPPCCNPDHLYLGTEIENARDMIVRQRHARFNPATNYAHGERVAGVKLTEAQVAEIRATTDRSHGFLSRIARQYGVCRTTIRRILDEETWAKVRVELTRSNATTERALAGMR